MPVLFFLGCLIQKYMINRLVEVESVLPENQVLLTVGIVLVLTELIQLIFKSDYRSVITSYSSQTFFGGGRQGFTPSLVLSLAGHWPPLYRQIFCHYHLGRYGEHDGSYFWQLYTGYCRIFRCYLRLYGLQGRSGFNYLFTCPFVPPGRI